MRPSKRNELVEKATHIFYRHGFQATGMDRLVIETGISKTSIYKHFRSKDELILATLQLRDTHIRNWLFRRIDELATEPCDQLIAIFDALDEWFHEPDFRGCMFAKASSEYQDSANPINRAAHDHIACLTEHFMQIATEAGLADPEGLGRQLMLLKEGAIAIATMARDRRPALEAKAIAVQLVAAAATRTMAAAKEL